VIAAARNASESKGLQELKSRYSHRLSFSFLFIFFFHFFFHLSFLFSFSFLRCSNMSYKDPRKLPWKQSDCRCAEPQREQSSPIVEIPLLTSPLFFVFFSFLLLFFFFFFISLFFVIFLFLFFSVFRCSNMPFQDPRKLPWKQSDCRCAEPQREQASNS
jgi:hypothetical protein